MLPLEVSLGDICSHTDNTMPPSRKKHLKLLERLF